MAILTVEIEPTEVDKVKAVLKALGGRNIKVDLEKTLYTALEKRVKEAREEKKNGELVTLDIKNIWESI